MVGEVPVALALEPAPLGARADHITGDARLVLAHVGEQRAPRHVTDRVQPVAGDRPGRSCGHRCSGSRASRSRRCRSARGRGRRWPGYGRRPPRSRPPRSSSRRPRPWPGRRGSGPRRPPGRPGAARSRHPVPTSTRMPRRLQLLGHELADERLLLGEQRGLWFDHRDLARAEAGEPGGRLAGHDPAADHRDPRRHLAQVGYVTRGPRLRLAQPVDRGNRGLGAGGDHHRMARPERSRRAVLGAHLDAFSPASRPWPRMTSIPLSRAHCTWLESSWSWVNVSRRFRMAGRSRSPMSIDETPGSARAPSSISIGRSSALLGMHAQ